MFFVYIWNENGHLVETIKASSKKLAQQIRNNIPKSHYGWAATIM